MWRCLMLVNATLLVVVPCTAQQTTDITEIAARSGIIFRGTVLALTAETPRAPDEVAVTRMTFRVEDGVRGATTGETLTIRQWNVAADEYRLGEALVLFLYAPSDELGLTSPVSGPAGHRSAEELSADGLDELYLTPMATPVAPPSTSTAPERSPRQRDRLQPHCNGQHDPRDRAEVHNDSRG